MTAIQVSCTSWVGYSAEAEHFYCRVQEHPIDSLEHACEENDHCVPLGDPFYYTPTELQAVELARKDNYRGGGTKIREDAEEYLDHGVFRFWSLHQICEEAHKKFPDKKLYGFFMGRHRAFCKQYRKESKTGKYQLQDFVVLKY